MIWLAVQQRALCIALIFIGSLVMTPITYYWWGGVGTFPVIA